MPGWEATKRLVWERDRGLCRDCGKNLLVEERVSDGLRAAHAALKGIPVYRWEEPCYFCGKTTPIVTYSFSLNYDYCISGVSALDELLGKDYPWVKLAYSRSQDKIVMCNTCTHAHCGKIAMGNNYVKNALITFEEAGELERLRVGEIPNVTAPEDFPEIREEHVDVRHSLEGRVHHLNRNREDRQLSNLVLLCRQCDTVRRKRKGI